MIGVTQRVGAPARRWIGQCIPDFANCHPSMPGAGRLSSDQSTRRAAAIFTSTPSTVTCASSGFPASFTWPAARDACSVSGSARERRGTVLGGCASARRLAAGCTTAMSAGRIGGKERGDVFPHRLFNTPLGAVGRRRRRRRRAPERSGSARRRSVSRDAGSR